MAFSTNWNGQANLRKSGQYGLDFSSIDDVDRWAAGAFGIRCCAGEMARSESYLHVSFNRHRLKDKKDTAAGRRRIMAFT
jgi:hypothetical protein